MSTLADPPPRRASSHRRRAGAVLVALLALAAVGSVTAPSSRAADVARTITTGPSPALEQQLFELLNDERTARGLAPLRRLETLDNVAREWSDTMAREQRLHHRPGLSTPFTGSWRRLGENVGVGYGPTALHDGFMRSSGHRANVLGDFAHVGVGVALAGSNAWVTVDFVEGDPSVRSRYDTNPLDGYATGSGRGGPFHDIDGSVHRGPIRLLDDRDIAISCATYRYCPTDGLRRAEMAELLVRALDLPPARERFVDVPADHPYAAAIGALAAAGITKGCNPPADDRFCPEQVVRRDQMASFLVRALRLRPTADRFVDVPRVNVHAADIGALASSGITRGCNPPTNDEFCPRRPVTRAEMASFLTRALDR